ncbi:MAG TPA: hypothetical protein VHZ56_02295 [Devosia sp.]|nr:hypothetical protein [Devosia sp.]
MKRTNEKLLVAVLAGVIIAGAAAYAIQPSLGGIGAAAPSATPTSAVLTLRLSDKA